VSVAPGGGVAGGSEHSRSSVCVELCLLVLGWLRRLLWLAIFYSRFTLVYVWYFVVVKAWEHFCWSASCTAHLDHPTTGTGKLDCMIEADTFGTGLPIWWFFMLYAWGSPTSFSVFMDTDKMAPSQSFVHDLLLTCKDRAAESYASSLRTCSRTCLEFPGVVYGGPNQNICVKSSAWQHCVDAGNATLSSQGLAPFNDCTNDMAIASAVSRPGEEYAVCWAQLPEMYIMAVLALAVLSICVQFGGMVRTPQKDSPFAGVMKAARMWSDHYYRVGDLCVGLGLISALWVLTVLPLNYLQSVLLFKRNFQKVMAARTRKADLLDRLIS